MMANVTVPYVKLDFSACGRKKSSLYFKLQDNFTTVRTVLSTCIYPCFKLYHLIVLLKISYEL